MESTEEGKVAIKELNGKRVEAEELYVGNFESKNERYRKVKTEAKTDNNNKRNLYVKHISDAVDEEMLKKEFEA